MANHTWFFFPVDVFLDSEVYISESYNFGEKGSLDFFKKEVGNKKFRHLTSEIVNKEVEKHIRKNIAKAIERYNKLLEGRSLAIFRGRDYSPFQNIDEAKVEEKAITIFRKYLADTEALILDVDTIKLKSVIKDYFEVNPPFGEGRDKKCEFPDAFNLAMIREYTEKKRPVIIVSADKGFEDEENIRCFKSLRELLDAINSQDKVAQKVKKYLKSQSQFIFERVESELMDSLFGIEVDGRDVGRKGEWDGFEYEETELLSVEAIACRNIDVVYVDNILNVITINLGCKTKLELDCKFFDEANSMWDSENKNYLTTYYGTMNETHYTVVDTTIKVFFSGEDEDLKFEILGVEVDTNIKLDQYTLQKDGRKRIDKPSSRWYDEIIRRTNFCPDCGCEITFENDGGNGFCTKCAPNH
jgi:hypothetical protein